MLCVDNYFTGTPRNIAHLFGDPRFEVLRHDVTFPLFVEVDEILRHISECQLKLMKMDKLRKSIVQAKLSHIRSQFEEAFRYWTESMSDLRRFTLASGRTTRIILLCQCHVLHRQGLFDVENRTRDQLDALERCAGMSGASYWISGLRHWLHFLESCKQL